MNNWMSKLLKQEPKGFETLRYRTGDKYRRYMADPVAVERRIILSRGVDAYNVGNTTREAEIDDMVCTEIRDAAQQLDDHLCSHKNTFIRLLDRLLELQEDLRRMEDDLRRKNDLIQNLETQIHDKKKGGNQNE